jgi:putative aminopeptidase FrvX
MVEPDRLRADLTRLMLIPGLSGHEGLVRADIAGTLRAMGHAPETDVLGNLWLTLPGDPARPGLMLIAHMDQLGFVVRKIEQDGLIRLERVGGVPERALAAQALRLYDAAAGRDRMATGVIGNKAHHATGPEEKYRVLPYADLAVDAGFASRAEAEAAGLRVGTPAVYEPRALPLAGDRLAGTAVDDRAGCAVLLALARGLAGRPLAAPVHLVWSVQEEFNLRGVLPVVARLNPSAAIQLDLILACDTPDMAQRGDVRLGGGPAMSLFSFHGRGTLNGLIPPAGMVAMAEAAARAAGLPLQRSAHTGALTETAYVQIAGQGVACLDLGFPMRYSHSALEVLDLSDLAALARLLATICTDFGGPA